jgi:hypothetical protein
VFNQNCRQEFPTAAANIDDRLPRRMLAAAMTAPIGTVTRDMKASKTLPTVRALREVVEEAYVEQIIELRLVGEHALLHPAEQLVADPSGPQSLQAVAVRVEGTPMSSTGRGRFRRDPLCRA